jgi:flavin-dependent dehydrogenase
VDRSRFDAALREAARSLGVTVMTAQAEAASRSSDGFRVMGRSFAVTCHELVDATGCAARIAGLLGVRRTIVDRQFVLFVVLDRTMPEPALHVVTFEDGWVYVSPQGKHGTQVAAVTDLEVLRARGPRGTMLRALRAMHLDVSGSELARVRGACSLSQVVHGLHPTGFSTIGDAAWTPDPLSGHGVARALVSAARWASGTSGGEPSRARQMLAHLRSRSDFMDSTPSSDAPYYRRRARAWRQAEEVLHGDPVEVDEGAETGGSRSHCLRGEGRRVADRAS